MKSGWILLVLALGGCGQHFITDDDYRATVTRDLEARRALLPAFDAPASLAEREAVMFLLAYSPLVDVAMHDGTFFLEQARAALRAREEMPWGERVPEEIFRHFVLPPRGGKEATLDSARTLFYRELKARVSRCATMEEAALEVNHWCHEKVIYQPTNARTMSPLATARAARGRCGEESIFALAALRAVCIPARQIYTPRWAHCDDNHAWIEAWVEGEWKYLGACEPEPRLNVAWFTLPVQRALYVEAEVFGRYETPGEEIVHADRNGARVNVTSHYTRTKATRVKVTERDGKPVAGARVEYRVYNYGEFYPVVTRYTDGRGESRLTLGEGDLVVWGSHGGRYGIAKLPVGATDSVTLVLEREGGEAYSLAHDLAPPEERPMEALTTVAEREVNERRLLEEDALREAYIATFISSEEATRFAGELGVDTGGFARLVATARGNGDVVVEFVRQTPAGQRDVAMQLLGVLAGKDLQDTPLEVLQDHLTRALPYRDRPLFTEYILNPRVQNEHLTAYRSPLEAYAHQHGIRSPRDWARETRRMAAVDSLYRGRVATPPEGVLRARAHDALSAAIFLVAGCRAIGVPARLDPVTGRAAYFDGDSWRDVEERPGQESATGCLVVRHDGKVVKDPRYFLHFTVARIEEGTTRILDLGSNTAVDMGAGASFSQIFAVPARLEAGDYILSTGNRHADGSVLAGITAFHVNAGETRTVEMAFRATDEALRVLGRTAPAIAYQGEAREETLAMPARGYAAVAIVEAGKEPTNHLLRDIAALKTEFEAAGKPVCILFESRKGFQAFSAAAFPPFPSTMRVGYDDRQLLERLSRDLALGHVELPLLLLLDRAGEVVFLSRGYRIGLGTQMLKIMARE